MKHHQLFLNDLNLHIQGGVLSDNYSLGLYSTDASLYQIKPVAIVTPLNENDVLTAIKIAGDHQVAILPRGGGTALAGQTVGDALIIDFSKHMHQILELNVADRWVRIQPGLVRDELNLELQKHGLHFAPDPATSSRANIGGMIGNNSSGTKSILYGKTIDHVLELKIALPDGTILNLKETTPDEYHSISQQSDQEGEIYRNFQKIIHNNHLEIEHRFPKVMRRVGGYPLDEFINTDHWNLAKLMTGSEGTLATTLEAKINLEPLPKFKSVCVVHYEDIVESIRSVESILEFQPSAVEILDRTVLGLSRKNLLTKKMCHFIEGDPAAVLIVEFYGETAAEVLTRPTEMAAALKNQGFGYAYPLFPEGENYNNVWTIRKKGLGLMLGKKGDKRALAFIEDAAIPIPHLPEYIEKVLEVCKQHDTYVATYAHASVGVLHVRPFLDLRREEDIETMKKIARESFNLVKEYGGSWSGEHGDGLVRSAFNEAFFGTQIYQAFKKVKNLFDPENRMNPGKIVDAPPMDQDLRYGVNYKDNPVKTVYKYREDVSFEASVHMCNGVGECRKMNGGTMCPSFKATREEEHTTRGRANALRLAMSGQMGGEGLNSPRLREVLDLCLSCKGCKSECPSNVDMAKLKSEVWQIHFDRDGPGLRDRMIRDSSKMSALFSGRFVPVINGVQSSLLFRYLLEKMIGIDRRRTLPKYTVQPFYKWFKKHYVSNLKAKKKVILFADTYLNYHEPQIGISATELLQGCGYEVILAHVGCCQRPLISHGFLNQAKAEGTKVAKRLDEFIQQGLPILVCEPSCASALNDDLADLVDDNDLAHRLKTQVMMIDQFLFQELESGALDVTFTTRENQISIHGHCHQKALYGTSSMIGLLQNIKGIDLEEIPSGCCGMAGSFGYEKEHYLLSQKVGEQVLFPAIRKKENATIIACGFSCRHQIVDFTDHKAKHLVEVLEIKK